KALLTAIPELNPCIQGFPSQCLFNYDYQIVNLSVAEFEFMQKCDNNSTVAEILAGVELGLDGVKTLLQQQLILLTPA
ncbi:MAG: SAM-dependent methyltransferase, partial [Nostoc sp.]